MNTFSEGSLYPGPGHAKPSPRVHKNAPDGYCHGQAMGRCELDDHHDLCPSKGRDRREIEDLTGAGKVSGVLWTGTKSPPQTAVGNWKVREHVAHDGLRLCSVLLCVSTSSHGPHLQQERVHRRYYPCPCRRQSQEKQGRIPECEVKATGGRPCCIDKMFLLDSTPIYAYSRGTRVFARPYVPIAPTKSNLLLSQPALYGCCRL